jgi:hypothetical protein
MQIDVARLQRFLAAVAAPGREVVRVAPFTGYLDREHPLRYFNYAIPDAGVGPGCEAALATLREAFRSRGRLPRLEYLDEQAPALAAVLAAAGMECELETPLMALVAGGLRRADVGLSGASVEVLRPDDRRAWANAQAVAFDDIPYDDDDELRDPSRSGGGAICVRLGDEPIGGASWTGTYEGVAEINGVFCVEHHRGNGVAGAATAAAATAAFAAGASCCVLTPGSQVAMRIYARAGFAGVATSMYWADPETA